MTLKLCIDEQEQEITRSFYKKGEKLQHLKQQQTCVLRSQRESLEGPTKHLPSMKESDCLYLLREKLLLAIY